jgi:hypothetical protein
MFDPVQFDPVHGYGTQFYKYIQELEELVPKTNLRDNDDSDASDEFGSWYQEQISNLFKAALEHKQLWTPDVHQRLKSLAIRANQNRLIRDDELIPFNEMVEKTSKIWSIFGVAKVMLGIQSLPDGTMFFGKEQWDKHIGIVDDVPLPKGIGKLLLSECGLFPGYKWMDKFMLFLLPQTIDGKPYTLKEFTEIAMHPKEGPPLSTYFYNEKMLEMHGNNTVERSRYVLMSVKPIPNIGMDAESMKSLINSYSDSTRKCAIPDLLTAHIGVVTHYMDTGKLPLFPAKYKASLKNLVYCSDMIPNEVHYNPRITSTNQPMLLGCVESPRDGNEIVVASDENLVGNSRHKIGNVMIVTFD